MDPKSTKREAFRAKRSVLDLISLRFSRFGGASKLAQQGGLWQISARSVGPLAAADSHPSTCCRSSVVEHSIGNGEVDSSILSGSTIFPFNRTRIGVLAARNARVLLSSFALSCEEGAGKAGCRLAPMIRCAKNLHTQMRKRDDR
jgi:hypothetical protein